MKNIFELIIGVLGLSICILSAQIPAVSWTPFHYTPFHYFVPHAMLQTDNIAVGAPSATDSATRPVIEKLEMTHLHRELSEIRILIAQLATKTDLHVTNAAVRKILSTLQILTTNFADLDAIKTQLDEKASELDLNNTNTALRKVDSDLEKLTQNFEQSAISTVVDIGRMPESCADLKLIGYKMNGFFQIKGKEKIENVYCDFTTNAIELQKWIGYAEIKSASVYFYVQRNSNFNTENTPIPFELERLNVGNAMNLASGIFTAPRPGIYFFSFAGTAFYEPSQYLKYFGVSLYLNDELIGSGEIDSWKNVAYEWSPLSLQSTLNLNKGDKVWLELYYSDPTMFLFDSSPPNHFTHFTGFMLEENTVASL